MQASTLSTNRQRVRARRVLVRPRARVWIPYVTLLVIVAAWQVITLLQLYPAFIIPPPAAVLERFWEALIDGELWLHTRTTVSQMLLGLLLGVGVGVTAGYFIAKHARIEHALSPLIVAVQATPVVAYAPLLVIWFGSGAISKVITSALIVCFPMLMNTVVGIRSVPGDLRALMSSLNATRWHTFIKLEVPAALPILLSGLKVSATLAVIGAVVGEFVSADAGLGRMINIARFEYDTPLVFVAVILLALIARGVYSVITWMERRVLAWQPSRQSD